MKETIHMRAPIGEGKCETHDWPSEGMGRRLIEAMRAHHRRGGINVCRDCLVRAREDAGRALGLPAYDATGTIAKGVPTRPADVASDRDLLGAALARQKILAERVHASSPQGSERERSTGGLAPAAHAPDPRPSDAGETTPSAGPPPRESTTEGKGSP